MKKKKSIKIVIAILFCVLALLFFNFMSDYSMRSRLSKIETRMRVFNLRKIRGFVLTSKIPFQELSLFKVTDQNSLTWVYWAIPTHNSAKVKKNANIFFDMPNRQNFYRYSQYRLIKDSLGWWGVVELEAGRHNKKFLMITKEGDIVSFDTSFFAEPTDDKKLGEKKE